jgi:hypothetical protein
MIFKKRSDMAKRRLKICSNCGYREYIAGQYVCGLCGCFLSAKAEVEDEKCYDNKW